MTIKNTSHIFNISLSNLVLYQTTANDLGNNELAKILGMAIGIPVGAVFLVVVICIIVRCCRRGPREGSMASPYKSWKSEESLAEDRFNSLHNNDNQSKYQWSTLPESWRGMKTLNSSIKSKSSSSSHHDEEVMETKMTQITKAVQEAQPIVSIASLNNLYSEYCVYK